MKKTYYFGVLAAIAMIALPALLNAQTMMDTEGATSIGTSIDANSGHATVNAGNSIRQQIRDDYQNRINNIENNRDYRNIMLGARASTTNMHASSTMDDRRLFVASSTTIQNMHIEMDRMRQNRVQELRMQKDRLVKNLNQAMNNLEQIRSRIETRITTTEQNGKDMAAPKNLLVIADAKISLAQQAIATLQNFNASSTITTTATTTVDITKPRQLLNAASQAVKIARDALNAVVVSIAHNLGLKLGEDDHRNATSTATTTITITGTSTSTQ